MKKRILTVSREFGSGGRTIAKKVAEKLGYPCYDSELINKITEESGLHKDFISLKDEDMGVTDSFLYNFSRNYGQISLDNEIYIAQFNVIKKLADKGPCVIVGRCSEYALRDRNDCIHVHIHASEEFRAKRIVEVYGERDKSPMERIKSKDKKRKRYHEFYTDRPWGAAKYYDICLDSGTMGLDYCVEIITEAMKRDW